MNRMYKYKDNKAPDYLPEVFSNAVFAIVLKDNKFAYIDYLVGVKVPQQFEVIPLSYVELSEEHKDVSIQEEVAKLKELAILNAMGEMMMGSQKTDDDNKE